MIQDYDDASSAPGSFVQTANPTPPVGFGWQDVVQTANPTPPVDFGWTE